MINRIFRQAQYILIRTWRDPRGIVLVLFVPMGLTMLVGWVLRSSGNDITVAVVTQGDHWAIAAIADRMDENLRDNGAGVTRAPDRDAAERMLRDGDAQGYVVVDDRLATAVLAGERHDITVGVVGDDVSVKADALLAIRRAIILAPLAVLRDATGGEPLDAGAPVTLDTRYVYGGGDYDIFDQYLPALFAYLLFVTIFTDTIVSVANDRGLHILERIIATPLRRAEYIAGQIGGHEVMAVLQAAGMILVAAFVMRAHHTGSLAAIFVLSAVVALCGVSLAVLMSALARSESEAMQLLPAALIPQFIIGGVLFPVSALPGLLQEAARFMPATYCVNALRDVMLRDRALTDTSVLINIAGMLAFTALFLVLGARTLEPEQD